MKQDLDIIEQKLKTIVNLLNDLQQENKVLKVTGRFNQHKVYQMTDATQFRFPYATREEQKCLRDGKPIGESKK